MSPTATGGKEKQMTFTIDAENNVTAFASDAGSRFTGRAIQQPAGTGGAGGQVAGGTSD